MQCRWCANHHLQTEKGLSFYKFPSKENIQREERDGLGHATAKMLMAVNGFRLLVTSICAVHISSQVSLAIYLQIAVIILPSAMKYRLFSMLQNCVKLLISVGY